MPGRPGSPARVWLHSGATAPSRDSASGSGSLTPGRRPRGYAEHWNVIEGLGEIGAALMPVQLGWAFEAGRQGRLPQGRALAFAGEDDGARVAMTLEMRGGPA